MMYDELVKSLRQCAEASCAGCKNDLVQIGCRGMLQREAADAIEALNKKICEYQLALDGANDKIRYALGKDYCYDLEYGRKIWVDTVTRLQRELELAQFDADNWKDAYHHWFDAWVEEHNAAEELRRHYCRHAIHNEHDRGDDSLCDVLMTEPPKLTYEELLHAAKKMHTWIFLHTGDEQKAYDECGLSDEMNAALGYGGRLEIKVNDDV